MEEIINIENLMFSYADKNNVINNLSLKCTACEKIAVIGANGSGKTTLFLIMCGLLKSTKGSIFVSEKQIEFNTFNPQISYLFQSPDDQLFSASIFDDVAFGPLNIELSKNEILNRVESALQKTNIIELKEKSPHHLSGGEKRLAAIATLISMSPDVYLFDEPTSNLDAKNRRNIINLINEMDKTMMISSHDLEFLLEVCSRCILISDGKIIADGEIKSILKNEKLLFEHHMEKPHSLIPHKHNLRDNN